MTDDDFTDEPVSAAIRKRWSRQRLLHLLLVAGLVLGAPTLVLALVDSLDGATAFPTARLAGRLAFLVAVAALIVVNRRGHTLPASWAICGILVPNGSWLFPLPELNTVPAMYATPILVRAFLIKPTAAVYLYVLSCADYLVAHLREGQAYPFNWLSLVVLGGVPHPVVMGVGGQGRGLAGDGGRPLRTRARARRGGLGIASWRHCAGT